MTHYKSNLQAEFHYYPFGLSINLAQAFGAEPQPQLFTNQTFERNEFTQGKGLNLYDFEARTYDPQIGRWWQVDPLADQRASFSTYNYCVNNPVSRVDPSGALDTKYVDEADNLIKETKDGQDKTVTVKDEDRKNFDIYVEVGEEKGVINNKGYNNWIESKMNNNSSVSMLDLTLAGVGGLSTGADILSKKIIKDRSGYTSGKINPLSSKIYNKSFANKVNMGAKTLGMGLTAFSMINTEYQYRNKKISELKRVDSHMKNSIGIAFPLTAIPIGIGDHLGQKYSKEIINSTTQPGGLLFETTSFMIRAVGLPTGE